MKQITATEIIALCQSGKKVLAIDLREGYRLQQYDAWGLRVPYKDLKTVPLCAAVFANKQIKAKSCPWTTSKRKKSAPVRKRRRR